ncbi:olfactory receptor 52P1-like [Malaclemys terrapin pileata]|uniref:olfactory receptor 52P1-like n=1 Tax=Malaclemys terrapin pileata TaxID=2991368 RepID=UPI0023A7E4E7|nr:olfactory receptor 52P1-like [Malaclemys terrapin pileata]
MGAEVTLAQPEVVAPDRVMPDTDLTLMGVGGTPFKVSVEAAHIWISIPFSTMYTIAILGNFTILFIVKREPSLHVPMYYFLCMLGVMMESGILVAMAFDRYVTICNPLRHSTILTNPFVAKIGLAVVLRGGMVSLPYPFLVRQWPYCTTNIIPQPFCTHKAVVKLACADTHVNSYYGFFVLFCVFASYFPGLFISLMYWSGPNVPGHIHVLIANLYIFMLPTLNPIIYGVRTKQIQDRLLRLFTHKGA